MRAEDYLEGVRQIPGLRDGVALLGAFESPGLMAAAIEFVLEGLHLSKKLNKDVQAGQSRYRGA
jgi:magnesium chelatase subunit I